MDDQLKDLEQRVSRLEAAYSSPAAAGTQLTAPLRVVDAHGRPLAVIDVYAYQNTPYLSLFNSAGGKGVTLSATPQGGAVVISNAAGATVAVLSAGPDGGDLWLHDKEGELIAAIGMEAGAAHLRIYDPKG